MEKDVIMNIKKVRPKKSVSRVHKPAYIDRIVAREHNSLTSYGYMSTEDLAQDGLDDNYDNRLAKELERNGIN